MLLALGSLLDAELPTDCDEARTKEIKNLKA